MFAPPRDKGPSWRELCSWTGLELDSGVFWGTPPSTHPTKTEIAACNAVSYDTPSAYMHICKLTYSPYCNCMCMLKYRYWLRSAHQYLVFYSKRDLHPVSWLCNASSPTQACW